MKVTPKGLRLYIELFGRRNTRKSSLLNAVNKQDIAMVSLVLCTTAHVVKEAMDQTEVELVITDSRTIDNTSVDRIKIVFFKLTTEDITNPNHFSDLINPGDLVIAGVLV